MVRNDRIDPAAIRDLKPRAIVLSPGPCVPQQAGCCLDIVRLFYRVTPILGVCLGHQVIAEAFGGHIVRANEAVHGLASYVRHNEKGIFAGFPNPLLAGRYHSLVVESASRPTCLETTAKLEDDTIMALQHREFPVVGWQFHPESVLTEYGYELLDAFLRFAKIRHPAPPPTKDRKLAGVDLAQEDWFHRAIELPRQPVLSRHSDEIISMNMLEKNSPK